jgi:hypothetical protein
MILTNAQRSSVLQRFQKKFLRSDNPNEIDYRPIDNLLKLVIFSF